MDIRKELAQLAAIVEPWTQQATISALERDLVLEKLRTLYQAVLEQKTGDRKQETGNRRQETGDRRQETGDRRQEMPEAVFEENPFDFEPVSEPDLFAPAPPSYPPTPSKAKPPKQAAPLPTPPPTPETPRPGRIDRRVILSLYGDSSADTAVSPARDPAADEPDFEVIGSRAAATAAPVLGETMAVATLRQGIGINDKFLIISEVFNGSAQAYEQAISDLEGFSDLDEAMIHIHENYAWNPHNEGVKVLVDVLTRKLS